MFQILNQEIKFRQTLIGIIHERQNFTLVYFYENNLNIFVKISDPHCQQHDHIDQRSQSTKRKALMFVILIEIVTFNIACHRYT